MILSLWDMMLYFKVEQLLIDYQGLPLLAANLDDGRGGVNVERLPSFKVQLARMSQNCREAAFSFTGMEIDRLLSGIDAPGVQVQEIVGWAEQIVRRIRDECSQRRFLIVDPQKLKYYDQPALFGSQVQAAFLDASFDIRETGDCFATDHFTASVFHAMRTLELGLRAFAGHLRLDKVFVDTAQWHNVIEKIEAEIRRRQQLMKGDPQRAQLDFYSAAASQFFYLKEAWRNHVSHSRKNYGEPEAERVLMHANDFMKALAENGVVERLPT
jgi:hypothetical protein